MAYVTTEPEVMTAAAITLAAMGSAMEAQNAAATAATTAVIPAAADEVSALTAQQFARHGELYQVVSAQAAEIHRLFVTTLQASAASYADTETANAIAAR